MAEQFQSINVSDNPAIKQLVDEVFHTRQPRVLRNDDTGAAVEVRPLKTKRARMPRGKRTSPHDPLWNIVGMAQSEGPTDVARNHDKYLAEWELSKMR